MKQTYDFYRESDNVYVNLSLSNTASVPLLPTDIPSIFANFDIQNDSPFLDDASKYYCSVVRFDIPLNTIPILIVSPQQFPNTNARLTNYVIGIDVGGTVFPVTLLYQPEDLNDQVPVITASDPTPITPYYYVYSYQTIINMINVALAQACMNAGLVAPFPYFILDFNTGLISLIVPTNFTTIPYASRPQIVLNLQLSNLLDSFPYYLNTNGYLYLSLNGTDFPPTADHIYTPPGPAGTFIFSEEYSTLATWSTLRDIIFVTNKLPINYESITIQNDTNTSRIPILSDFVPIFNALGQSRSIAYYLPTAQYKLVDMYQTTPLQAIDIKIFWRDTSGNIYPLTISTGQQINIKVAFLRKTLYKNNLLR